MTRRSMFDRIRAWWRDLGADDGHAPQSFNEALAAAAAEQAMTSPKGVSLKSLDDAPVLHTGAMSPEDADRVYQEAFVCKGDHCGPMVPDWEFVNYALATDTGIYRRPNGQGGWLYGFHDGKAVIVAWDTSLVGAQVLLSMTVEESRREAQERHNKARHSGLGGV